MVVPSPNEGRGEARSLLEHLESSAVGASPQVEHCSSHSPSVQGSSPLSGSVPWEADFCGCFNFLLGLGLVSGRQAASERGVRSKLSVPHSSLHGHSHSSSPFCSSKPCWLWESLPADPAGLGGKHFLMLLVWELLASVGSVCWAHPFIHLSACWNPSQD